jgi:hypothetical protein
VAKETDGDRLLRTDEAIQPIDVHEDEPRLGIRDTR